MLFDGSEADGRGGLDDDFHAFPDEFHGEDDVGFGDGEDALHMVENNWEGVDSQGSAQTISHSVGLDGWDESFLCERLIGVVGLLGFGSPDLG